MSDKRIKINLTDSAKDFIINESYDESFGARPIKRYVSRNLETLISKAIINDEINFTSFFLFLKELFFILLNWFSNFISFLILIVLFYIDFILF